MCLQDDDDDDDDDDDAGDCSDSNKDGEDDHEVCIRQSEWQFSKTISEFWLQREQGIYVT
jgi:hypothetical protein